MSLLAERYTLDVPLGESDLGTVWNAHDNDGAPLVVVTLEADADPPLHERFRAHAAALLGIKHPSVVRAIATGNLADGAPFLVLERVLGASLATRLESGPAPSIAQLIEIACALAEALSVVHAAGIAHGDVEPGNVLLVDVDGKTVPKLIAFGLNRASVRQELGARMSLPSITPLAYAAPEQARGDALDGPLADQASLAALVFAALTGRTPYMALDVSTLATAIGTQKAPSISTVRRELAPFASTLDRALSSDPKKRFADMAAFGRALKTSGALAKVIAASHVPLGPRSPIGEPPPPVAAPKAALIPKPGAAMPARSPIAAKVAKLKSVRPPAPEAAPAAPIETPVAAEEGTEGRATQEISVGDLELAIAAPELAAPSAPAVAAPPPPPASRREPTAEFDLTGLNSEPPPPRVVHAAPPPPPPPAHGTIAALGEKLASDPDPPKPPVSSPVAVVAPSIESAESQVKTDTRPLVPLVDEPSVAVTPSMENIVLAATSEARASAAKADAPSAAPLDDDVPSLDSIGGRKPWIVPVAIAAVVLLAIVAWTGLRASRGSSGSGRTLTTTAPPPTTAARTVAFGPPTTAAFVLPPTTVAIAPPPTSAPPTTIAEIVAPPPPTTVAEVVVPPSTTTTTVAVVPPPPTRVAPPPTTRVAPPTTSSVHTPPATHTPRPPTTRAPRTPRPPPTSAAHPPPSTGRRPTVVSDPGF